MLSFPAMRRLTAKQTRELKIALAGRTHSVDVLCGLYRLTRDELFAFVDTHRAELEDMRERLSEGSEVTDDSDVHGEPSPSALAELWITNKTERIRRYQDVADLLLSDIRAGSFTGAELATAVREYRSYCALVANELGQLLHRGAGSIEEGDSMVIEINGVDMDKLK